MPDDTGPRIAVVGTSGSGKSTLASTLAARLAIPHVELDALKHLAGWQERPPAEMSAAVAERLAGLEAWVVDGNYPEAREIVWPRATAIAWLDYPRGLVMRRVIRRTALRAALRRELFNGNREELRMIVAADHPIRWAWNTHAGRRAEFGRLAGERWVRLRSPRETEAWVDEVVRRAAIRSSTTARGAPIGGP
jgi:adenylate kinase family enzyme